MMEVTSAQIITDAHDRALRFRGRETHPFFSRDAMIMFRSHVHEGVAYKEQGEEDYSYVFITSEDNSAHTERMYTVRTMSARGSVDDVGEFGEHSSLARAQRAMSKYISTLDKAGV